MQGEDYAWLVRECNDYGKFAKRPRPKAEVDIANVELRDLVNACLSEILYAGAEKQRRY